MTPTHQPVLAQEVLRLLDPRAGQTYFDATAGYGGHAAQVAAKLGRGRMILVDRDPAAIAALRERFPQAEIWPSDFNQAADRLLAEAIRPDLILLDLGVSSPQLDSPERGFSFNHEGPLDMRMNPKDALTAATVVNDYPEARLADLIGRWGEEHRAKTVARAIVAARPLGTTQELAEVVRRVAGRDGRIDPATRTFQAIRLEVNQELEQLETALPKLTEALAPGGRIVVISFHSLEDRLVKRWFDRESRDCICPPTQPICTCDHQATLAKLTPKPIPGSLDRHNPRASSAKLRAACKLKPQNKGGE